MATVVEGTGFGAWLRRLVISGREAFRDLRDRIVHERSVRLMAVVGFLTFLMGVAVWLVERHAPTQGGDPSSYVNSFGKALYWMFISGTTTGYGDITPRTPAGRTLTVMIILSSMVLTSILTATIASWLVEKRLLEGKGMEKIITRDHLVICGWNFNGRQTLEGLYRDTRDSAEIVLINNLPEEQINELLYQFQRQGLRFVRGDFVHESVLHRANVGQATAVVILADGTINSGYQGADERTALCALAIKSINPGVKVCAELVDEDNVPHLRRAQVDHIVVLGEHNDFLLASAVTAPGVTLAIQELLNPQRGPLIQQAKVPQHLVDQDFAALRKHFREKKNALVIGVVSEEERGMALNDILSADLTAIDLFIKRQFEGMEEDYFFKGQAMKVRLNPPDSYKVHRNDWALLIAEAGTFSGGQGG